MGSSGGQTKTVTSNQPPQLMPEGKEGYERSNEFYKGILENPPQYGGERVAPFAPAQQSALNQQRGYYGQPQMTQVAAEKQVYDTAMGNNRWNDPITAPLRDNTLGNSSYGLGYDNYGLGKDNYGLTGEGFEGLNTNVGGSNASPYAANIVGARSTYNGDPRYDYKAMTDEEMQTQIRHASEPILADLEENIMPQIRNSSQLSGQGATSTRSDVARQKAVEGYGRTVGSSVIAPLMMQREQLTQDYDKAMQNYLQATAEGDANRATQAQVEMARISAQSHDNTNQINAQRDIAGADLRVRAQEGASKERIAGAGFQSGERIAGADKQSTERIAGAGYKSGERQTAADIFSRDKNAYSERDLKGWDAERNRELNAAGMSGQLMKDEAFRLNQLFQSGLIDQTQYQRMLDSAREQYEEPLYRQSQAAQALAGMSGVGPSGGESISTQDGGGSGADDAMQAMQMVLMIGSMAAKCSKDFKDNIATIIDPAKLIEDINNLKIKNWNYKWEPENKMLGPILEDCPVWLHDTLPKHLNMLNLVSALVLTIQDQNRRLERLENVLPS